MLLGEYLIEKNIITKEQLDIALKEQKIVKEKLGEILIRLNFAKRDDIINALLTINPQALLGEEDVFSHEVPENILIETKTVVLGNTKDALYIATLYPNPQHVVEILKNYTKNKEVILIKTSVPSILQKLNEINITKSDVIEERIHKYFEQDDIAQFINELIIDAILNRASDIHLEPQEKVFIIRYRIDGILYIMFHFPLSVYPQVVAAIKNKAGMDVAETRLPQDGSFLYQYRNRYINLRVATLPTLMGEKISIRILDREKMLLDIHELGITKLDEWLRVSQNQMGLILVCGPTGSGKTTTLYATVQWLDKLHRNVYSVEDPIEYHLPFINQVQINRRAGLDFAMYLRTIVRHDPDVIIVGEIRDKETADNALTLADTGHLVYSTLHTNDVPSTIIRLQNLGVDINALSFLLKGILVQRLVRKVCKPCMGRGCKICNDRGYFGRTTVSEIAVFESINDIKSLLNGELKYYSFYEDAKKKVQEGVTTKEEILRVLGIEIDV